MSFDILGKSSKEIEELVSIPLEQGNVFRLRYWLIEGTQIDCLNPFGTGQCLSTHIHSCT